MQPKGTNKIAKPNFSMTKQILANSAFSGGGGSTGGAAQRPPLPNFYTSEPAQLNNNSGSKPVLEASSNQNLNYDCSNVTTLPPIVAGKRINLPLGPHRYL